MSETKFVNGLFVNKPHVNAPDFVKAELSISVDRFVEWLKQQETTEKGYVKVTLKESKGGKLYAELNSWVSEQKDNDIPIADQTGSGDETDELPF